MTIETIRAQSPIIAQSLIVARVELSLFFRFFFFYKIHISPDTGVNDGVWWWGPLSSADQRSRLHSSMDAPKGYWVGRIKLKRIQKKENGKIVLLSEQKNKLSIDVNAVRLLNSRGDCP